MKATDTNDFFNSLNAGVFGLLILQTLSNVAVNEIGGAARLPLGTFSA